MAITIKKSKKDNAPVVFGAPIAGDGVEVKFGYGTLEKVLEKVGGADDGVIYFGYDETKNSGAIVARGKVVSSKILDITSTPADVDESTGEVKSEAKVVVSYVDADKSVKTLDIPVSADAKLKALADRVSALETIVGTKTDGKDVDTVFGTIAKEAYRAKTAETGLDTRVTNIETIMGDAQNPDKDSVINKVVEVIDWFKDVSEDETGKSLIADVAANKKEIGVSSADTEDGVATGIHKRLEDLEAKKHVTSDVTVTTGSYVSGVHVAEDGALTIDETELKASGVAAEAIAAGDDTVAVEGDKVSTLIASLAKSIKAAAKTADDAIKALDVTDTAVEGQYVSAVSETDGKITVTRADLPTLSVKTDSEQFVGVANHEVEIKTTALNTVGLTKDADSGKWKAGTVDTNATGLATAADVAGELVSDEEVIAEAFNDHEARINAVEGKDVEVTSADSDVAVTIPAETDVNDEFKLNVTGGKTTYTVKYADADVEKAIEVYNEKTIEALSKLVAKLDKRVTWLELK